MLVADILVEEEEPQSIVSDAIQSSEHVSELFHALHLLGQKVAFDEVTKLRVIAILRYLVQRQQRLVDFLLHLQRGFQGMTRRFQLDYRLRERAQRNDAAAHVLVVHEFFRVFAFLRNENEPCARVGTYLFGRLEEEFLKARQSDCVAAKVRRDRQIDMRGLQFRLDLRVNCLFGGLRVVLAAKRHSKKILERRQRIGCEQ